MHIPDSFQEQLRREFDGRLRARWSVRDHNVQIEQKVGVGRWELRPPPGASPSDDRYIRARDGYALVLTVEPGDRKRCPTCGLVTAIPVLQFKQAVCAHCGARFRAVYFPLGEWLLQHLRATDPYRGAHERLLKELEEGEAARERARKRALRNQTEAIWKDEFTRVFDIPSVGYTGREYGRVPGQA